MQTSSQAAAAQQQHWAAQTPAGEPATLLLSAATTFAHMLEAQFPPHDTLKTQHSSQQHHTTDTARQLGILLSLLGYIGSLSCPVSSHNCTQSPKASVSMVSDQDFQQTPGGSMRSEGQDQADSPGVQHVPPSEQEEGLAVSPGSQATPDLQSARQCQEICRQASSIGAAA